VSDVGAWITGFWRGTTNPEPIQKYPNCVTSDEMLLEIYRADLGERGAYQDHCCQFCGYGPNEPCHIETPDSPHWPNCLWLQLMRRLRSLGLTENEVASHA